MHSTVAFPRCKRTKHIRTNPKQYACLPRVYKIISHISYRKLFFSLRFRRTTFSYDATIDSRRFCQWMMLEMVRGFFECHVKRRLLHSCGFGYLFIAYASLAFWFHPWMILLSFPICYSICEMIHIFFFFALLLFACEGLDNNAHSSNCRQELQNSIQMRGRKRERVEKWIPERLNRALKMHDSSLSQFKAKELCENLLAKWIELVPTEIQVILMV